MFMTEGHHILVEPNRLKRGESIGKGAFATVYRAKMKTTDEVSECAALSSHCHPNHLTIASFVM